MRSTKPERPDMSGLSDLSRLGGKPGSIIIGIDMKLLGSRFCFHFIGFASRYSPFLSENLQWQMAARRLQNKKFITVSF